MTNELIVTEPVTALALITNAQRMLAEARTLTDFRNVRDVAETLRAGAKVRGMGIEAENMAAEVVIRAERGMGGELIRMAEAGERTSHHQSGTMSRGPGKEHLGTAKFLLPSLSDLGVLESQSHDWQRLARLDDESFEAVIRRAIEMKKRIARVDFYEVAESILGPDEVPPTPPQPEPRVPTRGLGPRPVGPIEPEPEPPREPTGYYSPPGPTGPGDQWTRAWAATLVALADLADKMNHGWPVQPDRSPTGWAEVSAEITDASLILRTFFRRVNAFVGEGAQ